jgi:hypothetical protein
MRAYIATKRVILIVVISLMFVHQTMASQYKGMGSHQYTGWYSDKKYPQHKAEAINNAKQSLWVRYVSTMPQAQQISYQKMAETFTNDLDRYISDVIILDESVNKDTKVVEVVIRASVNTGAVNVALNMNSAIQQSSEGSMFSFVFMAREVVSMKTYDDKVTSISKGESESYANEEAAVNGGSIASSESSGSFSKSTTGGSAEKKADVVVYSVTSAQDIDASMGQILSTAGYEVVDYGDVVGECGGAEPSDIREEFSQSDDMSRQTRKQAISGARECEVSYFATGTLDIGLKDRDPVSGNQRVYVSVRGQVWNITKRLPKKVASIGPVQFAGLGPNQQVAQRNALILASKEAAQSLVNQMNAKGLH